MCYHLFDIAEKHASLEALLPPRYVPYKACIYNIIIMTSYGAIEPGQHKLSSQFPV